MAGDRVHWQARTSNTRPGLAVIDAVRSLGTVRTKPTRLPERCRDMLVWTESSYYSMVDGSTELIGPTTRLDSTTSTQEPSDAQPDCADAGPPMTEVRRTHRIGLTGMDMRNNRARQHRVYGTETTTHLRRTPTARRRSKK
jgi:hypothetical protein